MEEESLLGLAAFAFGSLGLQGPPVKRVEAEEEVEIRGEEAEEGPCICERKKGD